jgi:hypothetical protein
MAKEGTSNRTIQPKKRHGMKAQCKYSPLSRDEERGGKARPKHAIQ